MKKIPRLVVDTNVFVSALINPHGIPARILKALRNQKVELVTSTSMIFEILRVLNYPRIRKYPQITDNMVRSVAALLVHHTINVEPEVTFNLSQDSTDNMFLEAAVEGRVDALVTGDKNDLLSLSSIHDIPILTARETVEKFSL